MAVGVKGADMVRTRWDVGLGARALRRGRHGFAACPHHHVVEGRHVLQNRALLGVCNNILVSFRLDRSDM